MNRTCPPLVVTVALALAGCSDTSAQAPDAVADPDASASDAADDSSDVPEADLPDPDAADGAGEPVTWTIDDLQFAGAFRVPAAEFGPSSMNFAQGPLAYHAGRGSIFIVGHNHQMALAEFTVPELVQSTTIADLEMAGDPVQGFVDVLGRVSGGNPQNVDTIGGMAFVDGALVVNGYEYYDGPGDNTDTTFVISDPADLASSPVVGFYSYDARAHAAGWLSPVPAAWQADVGAPWLTGSSSGIPIIGRTSVGPSAFGLDPAALLDATTPGSVATTTLLDFSLDHPLAEDLSNDTGDNDLWTHISRAVYGFVPPGTRTYVTIGHTGGHGPDGVCYKCTPKGADSSCGGYCAGLEGDVGLHYWLWDLDDLLAVKAGATDPWAPRPTDHGELEALFAAHELGGASFDPATGLLYVTFLEADREQGTYSNPPIIVVYQVGP